MDDLTRDRTAVFLDVDGVLGAAITRSGSGVRASVPGPIVERVQRLAAVGRLVWATSWGAEVREALGVALALPRSLPSVAIAPGNDPHAAKRSAIERFLRFLRLQEPESGWSATVWLDDRIRAADQEWAQTLRHPLELVRVDADLLLTDDDVERVGAAVERAVRRADERLSGTPGNARDANSQRVRRSSKPLGGGGCELS